MRVNFDIVIVTHNDENEKLAAQLVSQFEKFDDGHNIIIHSNRENNIGFGPACNIAAAQGNNDIIGFMNPDAVIVGNVSDLVEAVFDENPNVVITGERFGKPQVELNWWGVKDWVCGAAFFVRRSFFEEMGGFDENYVWGWEETDLIRQAETAGFDVQSIKLPVYHASPEIDSEADNAFKTYHFERGRQHYEKKWGRHG